RRLAEFSRQRGILLVPGVELLVEGKHVVVLNPDKDQCAARTYSELRALGRRNAVILAPHPYYPLDHCLRNALVKNIDVFDAIEYSSVYLRGIGFNGRARRVAQRFGLPLVGTSDMHFEPFTDTTFTWIQAEPCVNSVVEAVREGRVRLDTRSCTCTRAAQMFWRTVRDMTQGLWTRQN
ncbi:MAG TPA: PHP domain-containing protein, partial [Candidatus Hydrogenedentes bacterium]|nr:PHP domain-containing protein [Candidatus Hydrogenedentota bacterium]